MLTALCYMVIILIVIESLKIFDCLYDLKTLSSKRNREKNKMLDGSIIVEHLYYLTPFEFESWCSDFLGKIGYENIEVTPPQADGGKDIICYKGNRKYYVECKRYSPSYFAPYKVDAEIVKKLVGAMIHGNADCGIIITTGNIRRDAYNYKEKVSSRYQIEFIDAIALEGEYGKLVPQETYL